MEHLLPATLIAYFIGSIPSGLILARLSGYGDIRKIGSGNIGATNVLRTGNKLLAALTLFFDGIKGFFAVWFPFWLFADGFDHYHEIDRWVYAIIAIIAHIFPVWLKFKGGKGVATAIGATFAINPLIAVTLIAAWLIIFRISRISSLSALGAFATATLIQLILFINSPTSFAGQCHVGSGPASYVRDIASLHMYVFYIAPVTLILFLTHRENIVRLMRGTEHKWSKS